MREDNVRLVNSDGTVDSSWYVDPGNQSRIDWSMRLLADYRLEEPASGWRLQTRGEFRDWHDWQLA